MKEFDKIYDGQSASFKKLLCKNTEHINGVILGVEKGEFAGQDKFVAYKDGSIHFDTDIFLSPEKQPPVEADPVEPPPPPKKGPQGVLNLEFHPNPNQPYESYIHPQRPRGNRR